MKRATTSLPVPDSPVTSTVVSVSATWVAFLSTSRHSADSPTTRMCVFESSSSESICDPRFEPLGACLRLGGLPLRLDQLLVRDRERDVIRDPACRRQIARRERSRPFRPEGQVDDLLTGRDSHAQEGAIAGRDDRRERVRGVEDRQRLGADVGDDEFIGPRRS